MLNNYSGHHRPRPLNAQAQSPRRPDPDPAFDELVMLANVGLMIRGRGIPQEIVLASNLVETLREAVLQVTGRKAPGRRKDEYIRMLLESSALFEAPALLKRFGSNSKVFPFDEFFYANPEPRGFTAKQTMQLGVTARITPA
jgi:hypothetical protein